MYTTEDFEDGPIPTTDADAGNPELEDVAAGEAVADTDVTAGMASQATAQVADTAEAEQVATELQETAENNPEEITEEALKQATGRINALIGRYGKRVSVGGYSRESFATSSDKRRTAKLAVETIMGSIKSAGSTIVEFFKKLGERFKTWIANLFSSAKRTKKAAEDVKKICEDREKEDISKKADSKVKLKDGNANLLAAPGSKEVKPDAVLKSIPEIAAESEKLGAELASVAKKILDLEPKSNDAATFRAKAKTELDTLKAKASVKYPVSGHAITVVADTGGEFPKLEIRESAGAGNLKDVSAVIIKPADGAKLCEAIATAAGKFVDDKRVKEMEEALSKAIKDFQKHAADNNVGSSADVRYVINAQKLACSTAVAMFTKDRNIALKIYNAAIAYAKASALEVKSESK